MKLKQGNMTKTSEAAAAAAAAADDDDDKEEEEESALTLTSPSFYLSSNFFLYLCIHVFTCCPVIIN
jgi:hypothetical protein